MNQRQGRDFLAAINCCITAIHMEHKDRSTPYIGAELIPPWDPFMIETLRKGYEKKTPTELG